MNEHRQNTIAANPSSGLRMLNLGCGRSFHPDWTNIDFTSGIEGIIQHDLRTPLPLEDGSFDAVYSSHVLEHFSRNEAARFLGECHRVLRPGGILRIVVPDLETIARLYLQNLEGAATGDNRAEHRHEWMTIELIDQMTRTHSGGEMLRYWQLDPMPAEDFVIERLGSEVRKFLEYYRSCPPAPSPPPSEPSDDEYIAFRNTGELHKWMYDRVSLAKILSESGHIAPRKCQASESAIRSFATYHLDTNPDGSTRKPDSLFMEALKPE